jgi:hypothetical protein
MRQVGDPERVALHMEADRKVALQTEAEPFRLGENEEIR